MHADGRVANHVIHVHVTINRDVVGSGLAGPDAEARQRRAVEREGRRRRRRERRQRVVPTAVHDEGMSSDDELLETDRIDFTDKFGN